MFWPSSLQFWGASPRVLRTFSLRDERLGWPEVCAPSPRVRHAFSLRGKRPGKPKAWCPLLGSRRPLPPRPQCAPPVGSQEVIRQDPGPVCWVGGGGFSGAEFAPFRSPCLLPPAGMGRLFSGVSQSLCFANRRRCVPPVNFSSLSHSLKKAPSDCSQGLLAGPHPKECLRLLSVPPPLAGGGCGRLGYFSAGSCF